MSDSSFAGDWYLTIHDSETAPPIELYLSADGNGLLRYAANDLIIGLIGGSSDGPAYLAVARFSSNLEYLWNFVPSEVSSSGLEGTCFIASSEEPGVRAYPFTMTRA